MNALSEWLRGGGDRCNGNYVHNVKINMSSLSKANSGRVIKNSTVGHIGSIKLHKRLYMCKVYGIIELTQYTWFMKGDPNAEAPTETKGRGEPVPTVFGLGNSSFLRAWVLGYFVITRISNL